MPSPIAHSVSGYVISQLLSSDKQAIQYRKWWNIQTICFMFIAVAPDLDFVPQLLTGERYHQGLTHSLTFTIIFVVIVGLIGRLFRKQIFKRLFLLTSAVYGSHLLLDFFTEGGSGIQFLWPFTNSFFISPLSVFPGAHHSRGLFDPSHLIFIGFELCYSAVLLAGLWIWKKRNRS